MQGGDIAACPLVMLKSKHMKKRKRAPRRRPDYLARLRAIYGTKMLKVSGAELLAEERNRY
jgi:hypothetical protein